MGWLSKVLTFPVSLPVDAALWTARKLAERAEEVYYDEAPIRAALMELEMKLDLGEIDEESFEQEETQLLQRLKEIREYKAAQAA
ncbi:MAG: gas vesicle protein GvpG [Caldilineaceae bacterium]